MGGVDYPGKPEQALQNRARHNSGMTQSSGAAHVYLREIRANERTSLSVLVGLIPPNSRILDLGTGSGALGQYLTHEKHCTVDGVTYNPAERDHALPHYRRLEIADLDHCDLATLFAGQRYDFIVCADVLEHLRQPDRLLEGAKKLLGPQGLVLISIPNAAYAGLVGELIAGEFRYREEGLLDRTHLRFYTRRSLKRFLRSYGWAPVHIETIERPLPESEFTLQFDSLPPAVARYLLARPDTLAYQFIVCARPDAEAAAALDTPADRMVGEPDATLETGGEARFSLQLYFGDRGNFHEKRKLTTSGVIGELRQTVTFMIAGDGQAFDVVRLDPADRPGFLQLHKMALRDAHGQVLWGWDQQSDGLDTLAKGLHHEIVFADASPLAPGGLALLHGDDPWVELPIPVRVLESGLKLGPLFLDIELGWPMSADYLSLASPVAARIRDAGQAVEAERAKADAAHQQHASDLSALRAGYEEALQRERDEWNAVVKRERGERDEVLNRERSERDATLERERRERDATLERERRERDEALAARELERRKLEVELATSRTAADEHRQRCASLQSEGEVLSEALLRERRERDEALAHEAAERGRLDAALASTRMQVEAQRLQNNALMNQKKQLAFQSAQLEQSRRRLTEERDQLTTHLHWIENSTIFRATRPLVRWKMAIDRWRSGAKPAVAAPMVEASLSNGKPVPPPPYPVDVIVPVYRGLADTRLCIESVLAQSCATPWRLVVINDASPEPEVSAWLRSAAANEPRIVLLENPENLGFVATVNRGMALAAQHDVVLLNSDTEVANDWLDRLRRAAYADERVASVTPFSNNATICSYPRFCQDNTLPPGYDARRLDALFSATNAGQAVDVPTGVGFCMYIRRDALDAIGLFDVETFGKGYGEENDFCRRAAAIGWRNLHLLDTFVMHSGGVSFGENKSPREQAAMVTLRRLYPDYEPVVHRFVADDPARLARLAVDAARIRATAGPVVLSVVHDRSGGTLRHVRELAVQFGERAAFLMLAPAPGGVRIDLLGTDEGFSLRFQLPDEFEDLVTALQGLGVGHVHFHHLLGHGEQIRELPLRLGVAYDFTAHDYYTLCPQISLTDNHNAFCGEDGSGNCGDCARYGGVPGGVDIASWRAGHAGFITRARHVLAPSRDVARRFARFLPEADTRFAPHTDLEAITQPTPTPSPIGSRALRVVVLGALSAIKGADLLEATAREAARRKLPVEFHLLGFAYRSLRTQPHAALSVHGEYQEADLPRLLAWLQPDVAWFPAQWPETYSYTLSACLAHGLPVVGPDIGAFPERLAGRAWSWTRPWNDSAEAFGTFFDHIRADNFVDAIPPARSWPVLSVDPQDAIVGNWSYQADYLSAVARPPGERPPLSREFLARYQADRATTAGEAVRRGLKLGVLHTLVRLRSSPGLRLVARRVPKPLQTRIKTWLRA